MQLFKKQKTFWECFSAFFKSRSKFQHCEKNDDPHSLYISAIPDRERRR